MRPAGNVQLPTTTDTARAIVGISVTNRGSDQGQSTPMLEQIEARTGVRPTQLLVGGGLLSLPNIVHGDRGLKPGTI